MIELLLNPEAWIAFLTLTALTFLVVIGVMPVADGFGNHERTLLMRADRIVG